MAIKRAVLVTGDRDWGDIEAVGVKMGAMPEGTLFIHGNATGADWCCDEMASKLGYPRIRVPYFGWLGRAGGPVRNKCMLDILLALRSAGAEVFVLAFHDDLAKSKGTRNMVDQARKAQVKVRHYHHGH